MVRVIVWRVLMGRSRSIVHSIVRIFFFETPCSRSDIPLSASHAFEDVTLGDDACVPGTSGGDGEPWPAAAATGEKRPSGGGLKIVRFAALSLN